MLLLPGTLLRLRTPINSSAYKENLQLLATKDFFKISSITVIIYWNNYICRHYISGVVILMFCVQQMFIMALNVAPFLETAGIRVPARNIRNFTMFSCFSSHCPSARCASAANAVRKSTDISRKLRLNVNNLHWFNSLVSVVVVVVVVLVSVLSLLFCIRADCN
jgi:hypothetical protein